MGHRLLVLLQLVLVLACPALGGRCCAGDAAFDSISVASESVVCDGCCHNSDETLPSDPVRDEDCPRECHDCICEGAIVDSGVSIDAIEVPLVRWDLSLLTSDDATLSRRHAAWDRDRHIALPDLGCRLATLGTLLI